MSRGANLEIVQDEQREKEHGECSPALARFERVAASWEASFRDWRTVLILRPLRRVERWYGRQSKRQRPSDHFGR